MLKITYQPKGKEIKREWHLVSAKGKILGRLATDVARLLMGKQKRTYSPHLDSGDYVVVTDSSEVKLTGRKEEQKVYTRYTGYPGGLRSTSIRKMREKKPERIIEHAVRGMLPKNRLQADRMARLKVFAGSDHPYNNKLGRVFDFKSQNSNVKTE
ncbi:50S ribosomal protein L13 [Candidatus Microgenomates bacterium]|nr:50S ribosomal protein L13 [Candidatus Microgenomates bacterium]